MCVCEFYICLMTRPIRHMHAFKTTVQLPHTRKSIAEKGQKDSTRYRIRKTISDRGNFLFSSWSISPPKSELYNLCWIAAMPEKRLELPKLKYEEGVSQQITFGCFSHLNPLKITNEQYISWGNFIAVGLVKCTAEDSPTAHAASAMHRTVKMWRKGPELLPRPHKTFPSWLWCLHASNSTCTPCPPSVGFSNPSMPSASLCTWICKHKTLTPVWFLSLCCASIPWPSMDATACSRYNICIFPYFPPPHLLTRML